MSRVSASIDVPGLASEAEALWYDPVRWAAWVDGFKAVASLADGWPAEGRLIWDSHPGGRGRVLEQVVSYEARVGQTLSVEDERLRGTQTVSFTPGDDQVTVALELDYELKERTAATRVVDLLFIRRQVEASLRRTLAAFARERRGDLEWEAQESR
jgi:hypothetical protein